MQELQTLPIKRALLSVSQKDRLLPLAQALKELEVELLASDGTAQFLRENGFTVANVESVTGFPEILDGRVKTLHPAIHGGILFQRDQPDHVDSIRSHQIPPIDLVVVELYQLKKDALISHIDIGGPTLIRGAAKNHDSVAVLCQTEDYADFIAHLKNHRGTTLEFRQRLALRAFEKTSRYDTSIHKALQSHLGAGQKPSALRYGENPHQQAQVHLTPGNDLPLASAVPLQGKQLSYNNLVDTDAAVFALRCLMTNRRDSQYGVTIIKHATPCGIGLGSTAADAFGHALASDPTSAFGGIVACAHPVDTQTALSLREHFFEVIIAPMFTAEALTILASKKALRLIELPTLLTAPLPNRIVRTISGGVLMQDNDLPDFDRSAYTVATHKAPSEQDWQALDLAWRSVIPVKSNAIVIANANRALGIGAGQTSRVDSVLIAISKARQHKHQTAGAVLASDAFFPFSDSIELCHEARISAIIQPGGSIRDAEVVAACNNHGIAMVFSHQRHFRH